MFSGKVRLAKTNEMNFMNCVKFGLWASNVPRMKRWQPGEMLVFVIEKAIAGIGVVCGRPFRDFEKVWDGAVYPCRIPVRFITVYLPENRRSFEPVRNVFMKTVGKNYGTKVVNQTPLSPEVIRAIEEVLEGANNDLDEFMAELEDNLQREREARAEDVEQEMTSSTLKHLQNLSEEITYKKVPLEQRSPEDVLTVLLIQRVRNDPHRLDTITKQEFSKHLESEWRSWLSTISMEILKRNARDVLEQLGLMRPTDASFGKGRYLIVSDSHGKHTPSELFQMFHVVNHELRCNKVIHIGHILDDDGIISYRWHDFKNLVVVSRPEEALEIEKHIRKSLGAAEFDVVRDAVMLGNLEVSNQDLVQDYSKTMFGGAAIEPDMFPETVILSGHRQEVDTRVTYKGVNLVVSPGCVCEPHIQKAIRKVCEGDMVKVIKSQPEYTYTHRRRRHIYKMWDRGFAVVEVDAEGNYSIIPCRIQQVEMPDGSKQFCTAYFNRVFTENGPVEPDTKIMVAGDAHVPRHDPQILDILDQVAKDFKADIYVNLGDYMNYGSLSHHTLDRGEPVFDDMVKDYAHGRYILEKMSRWAKKRYILRGNHERFSRDFIRKNPQLTNILSFDLWLGCKSLGYEVVDYQDILTLGSTSFAHGDINRRSPNTIKRIFPDHPTFIGHFHRPQIKGDLFAVGLTGLMDQEYNAEAFSNWVHGFGLVVQYRGVSMATTIPIIDYQVMINSRSYTSGRDDFWQLPEYTTEVSFCFRE